MKRNRFLSFLLAAFVLSSSLLGCGKEQKDTGVSPPPETTSTTQVSDEEKNEEIYAKAAKKLAETGLEADGSYRVTAELLTALEYATYTEPKNIIMMIGDGMGQNIVDITEVMYADSLYEGKMAMHHMPFESSQSTYAADSYVTDSAAGGTALATGYKTANGVIGKDSDQDQDYKNVLELAAQKGKSTGIVVTKVATDATPAAYSVHADQRGDTVDISMQQLSYIADGTLDLLMGGGSKTYFGARSKSIREEAIEAGATFTTDWAEASAAELPIGGFFCESSMSDEENMPTVAQMTELALDRLSKDENGFFLMVEGSEIDSYGHSNDLQRQAHETYDFDCAVAVAMRFVALNPDTVLIITADHETGGLHVPAVLNKDTIKECYYTTNDHTQINVPVYAAGYGVEELCGITENTDIAGFVAAILGEDDFNYDSTLHPILDFNDGDEAEACVNMNPGAVAENGGITVSFDEEIRKLSLPIDKFNTDMADLGNVRAFHVTIKNTGDAPAPIPTLTVRTPKTESITDAAFCYIQPGETITCTYVLHDSAWFGGRLRNLNELTFSFGEDETGDYTLTFDDLLVTERDINF